MDEAIGWDETKRLANLAKHGLDFADLSLDFFANATHVPAKLGRSAAIGRFADRIVLVIYVRIAVARYRVISMRVAHRSERKVLDA